MDTAYGKDLRFVLKVRGLEIGLGLRAYTFLFDSVMLKSYPYLFFITILNTNEICIFIYFILFSYLRIIVNQKGTFMVRL